MALKILHVTPSFYPATYYGGPIVSTHAMCNAMARRSDVNLRVLTTDANGPEHNLPFSKKSVFYPDGYEVYFARRIGRADISPELLTKLWNMVDWADVVQLTGVYSFPSLPTLAISRLLRKPLLWSPRGALLASQNWSEASRGKAKRIWDFACSMLASQHTYLHVTSASEQEASLARIRCRGALLIPNGIDIPEENLERLWVPKGKLRLMFIGRLHPVKAIERIIESLKFVKSSDIQLDIYGCGDSDYTKKLEISALEYGNSILFHGQVEGVEKTKAFANADICILASHTENFSMVVAEALAHGVPVIVSKGTPWADVEVHNCGLWVENDPQSLADAINSMREGNLRAMGARGRAWMIKDFNWNTLAEHTVSALQKLSNNSISY